MCYVNKMVLIQLNNKDIHFNNILIDNFNFPMPKAKYANLREKKSVWPYFPFAPSFFN